MKIMQVNCHFNYGSTGKIMNDIANNITQNGDFSIQCYTRGKYVYQDGVYKLGYELISKIGKLVNKLYGRPLKWGSYSTKKLIKIIEKNKPDIVHLHCINAYTLNVYKLLEYLKMKKIPTVITLHAEFMYTGRCAYTLECDKWLNEEGCIKCHLAKNKYLKNNTYKNWKCMKIAFTGFDINKISLISVSPWLKNRAQNSIILKEYHHQTILNGIDTRIFYRRTKEEVNEVKNKYGLSNYRILLHVTSDFDAKIKGGDYIIKIAEKLNQDRHNNIKIVVVGPHKNESNIANLQFLGVIKNQDILASLYTLADLTIITSLKETFSMICAESMCCGTNLLAFKAGAPETIALPQFSYFCDQGDIDTLYNYAITHMDYDEGDRQFTSKVSMQYYSANRMVKEYYEIYRELINDKN